MTIERVEAWKAPDGTVHASLEDAEKHVYETQPHLKLVKLIESDGARLGLHGEEGAATLGKILEKHRSDVRWYMTSTFLEAARSKESESAFRTKFGWL